MNDAELVEGLFGRDEDVIGEIKRRYKDYCLYIARNILSNEEDAEECLNDVLLAAWNSIPPNRPKNLRTYLGKIMRESAIDRLRINKAGKRTAPGDVLPLDEFDFMIGSCGVQKDVESAELSGMINFFLGTLKDNERNIFIRRYWYFDPIESICTRYGFGKGKVKMTLKRTRDRLADFLKKEGYLYER
ncbi:MAG: sigma-70 family RNA polymerase sigma factor [Clostridia bacterium]|nr:sigma-70 family RNA polymerase sigma factor [Clostridia bacterium]